MIQSDASRGLTSQQAQQRIPSLAESSPPEYQSWLASQMTEKWLQRVEQMRLVLLEIATQQADVVVLNEHQLRLHLNKAQALKELITRTREGKI